MSSEKSQQRGLVRPAIKRGQRYEQEDTTTPDKVAQKLSPQLKIPRPRSCVDVREKLTAFSSASGFPGFAPRNMDYGSRDWSYHLIRHIHHRQSPVGSHLRPLSLNDQRIITRGISEQLRNALERLVAHGGCGKACECRFRPRCETEDKGVYFYDSEDEEEQVVYSTIDDAVRAEFDMTPEILVRVKEAAIEAAINESCTVIDVSSPPDPENDLSTPSLSDSQSPTPGQPETPAWVMTPSISWPMLDSAMEVDAVDKPSKEDVDTALLTRVNDVAQRPRARTIDSAMESGQIKIREAQQKQKKVMKETDGIRALRILQQKYASQNREWIVRGGFDEPVQVWVEEWANAHPGILKPDEPVSDGAHVGEVAVDMGKFTLSLEDVNVNAGAVGLVAPVIVSKVAEGSGRQRSSSNQRSKGMAAYFQDGEEPGTARHLNLSPSHPFA